MSQAPPVATPHIDRLLGRLRARLVREVWLFGMGRVLAVAGLWVLASFLIDWTLHVPLGVRYLHLAVLVLLPSVVFYREVLRRLRCVPDRAGLAVLVERAHPELREVLVSAVELVARPAAERGAPDLVERVVAEAEERAAHLALASTSDPRPPRRALALGLASGAATVAVLALLPLEARIYLQRLIGRPVSWPQRTHLTVEVPLQGEVHSSDERLELAVARGGDLPVLVRVRGEMPDEVTLHFESGKEVPLGRAGKEVFRTLLRSVQEDLAFHVEGGDDRDGTPAVAVTVLQPPDVTGVALRIIPPAYSGLEERLEFDRDVRVLAGSRLGIAMLSDPPLVSGVVRLFPEDREVQLDERAWPDATGEARTALGFDWTARGPLRYRFELRDEDGLANPDPGLFAVDVLEDRAPSLEVFAPARGEVETVVGGALPLRALCEDDFGLRELSWTSRPADAEETAEVAHALEARPLPPDEHARDRRLATTRFEIATLFGDDPALEGEVFELGVAARDNREPEAQLGRSAPVRVRIVSSDEFLRRLQDRLGRVRTRADSLAELLRKKQGYTRELVASLEADEPGAADAGAIGSALSGARRVQGDARALARELAAVTSAMLYSRLDDRAGALLEALDQGAAEHADRDFHPELWLELHARHAAGELGQADFADRLLEIVGVALEVSEVHVERALVELRSAVDEPDLSTAYDRLVAADTAQAAAASSLEELLRLLSEWDSYQSILASTRDLLNRQKNLLDRTRQFYKDN